MSYISDGGLVGRKYLFWEATKIIVMSRKKGDGQSYNAEAPTEKKLSNLHIKAGCSTRFHTGERVENEG